MSELTEGRRGAELRGGAVSLRHRPSRRGERTATASLLLEPLPPMFLRPLPLRLEQQLRGHQHDDRDTRPDQAIQQHQAAHLGQLRVALGHGPIAHDLRDRLAAERIDQRGDGVVLNVLGERTRDRPTAPGTRRHR